MANTIKQVRRIISFTFTEYSNFQPIKKEVTCQEDSDKIFELSEFKNSLKKEKIIPENQNIYITLFIEIPL